MSEAHQGDIPIRTAAPSQASTMMPTSYDKNTSVTAGEGKDNPGFYWAGLYYK